MGESPGGIWRDLDSLYEFRIPDNVIQAILRHEDIKMTPSLRPTTLNLGMESKESHLALAADFLCDLDTNRSPYENWGSIAAYPLCGSTSSFVRA